MESDTIPRELENQVYNANRAASKICYKKMISDWVPIGLSNHGPMIGLGRIINEGEASGLIKPGQRVIDLGSGSGSALMMWAYRGYDVTGIELHSELVKSSRKIISNANGLFGDRIRIFTGSYYPAEYIKLREHNQSQAKELEHAIHTSDADRFHPVSDGADVYFRNNFSLKDMDVWYAYTWSIQSPSILEMFSLYARDDAVLCLVGGFEEQWLKQFSLKQAKLDNVIGGPYIMKASILPTVKKNRYMDA